MNAKRKMPFAGFACLLAALMMVVPNCVVLATEEASSTQPVVPQVPLADLREVISGNTEFAFDLYRALWNKRDNLFFSPYSLSLGLAMVIAGARGLTEEQMASALHFTLSQNRLHPAFGALHSQLIERGKDLNIKEKEKFQLCAANSLWVERQFELKESFRDLVVHTYRAQGRSLDFSNAPEASRKTINAWVFRKTKKKINELLPEGSITSLTRLVPANAITFSATWEHQFGEISTSEDYFHLLNGRRVIVPMMEQITSFPYAETREVQAVELPYVGEQFSMVILLPRPDQFEAFASSLTADRVASILVQLDTQLVQVYMPRFEFGSSFQLSSPLRTLGMRHPFVLGLADFTGMADTRELFLGEIYHQTLVSVDEKGTFAVVAAAADLIGASAPTMKLDRPFIFLIRDIQTNTILFIGQVLNPSRH